MALSNQKVLKTWEELHITVSFNTVLRNLVLSVQALVPSFQLDCYLLSMLFLVLLDTLNALEEHQMEQLFILELDLLDKLTQTESNFDTYQYLKGSKVLQATENKAQQLQTLKDKINDYLQTCALKQIQQ